MLVTSIFVRTLDTIYLSILLIHYQTDNKQKAVGYLRIMERGDVLAFLHLLKDTLEPLMKLSKGLQDMSISVAEAAERLTSDKDSIQDLAERLVQLIK